MSEDFDKSDSPTGIDFHEAQRLFIERFEETYADFIAYFNKRIVMSGLQTQLHIEYMNNGRIRGYGVPPEISTQQSPSSVHCVAYFQKKGFDCHYQPGNRRLIVDWSRRDGGMYPS